MINVQQFRELIVRLPLKECDVWSQAAENLLIGTALTESLLSYLSQYPEGPARGVFQMEGNTYYDVVKYLRRKEALSASILKACHYVDFPQEPEVMISNLKFAALMCRAFYWRFEEPLPDANDVIGLAHYHKLYYNTIYGKADPSEFVRLYRRYAGCPTT